MPAPTVQELLDLAKQLSEPERVHLFQELGGTLAFYTDTDVAQAWETEIHRRLDDLEAGRDDGGTLDGVFRYMDQRLEEHGR